MTIRKGRGLVFIESRYLSPVSDILDVLELYERITPGGTPYIVAKAGFLLQAVIMPYDVISQQFVDNLKRLTEQCVLSLDLRERIKALADATGVTFDFLMGVGVSPKSDSVKLADVKITFVKACRCLRKSEDSVRKLMMDVCEFGKAVQGTGDRLNYIFYPAKFREYVGPERFDSFFGLTA